MRLTNVRKCYLILPLLLGLPGQVFAQSPSFMRYVPPGSNNIRSIVTGPDGALWFTDAAQNTIGRLTTSGVFTMFPAGTSPFEITLGPDGAFWFTNYGNTISRMTTNGAVTSYTVPTANCVAYGITTGPDGALWFTELVGAKIGRITTSGAITEFNLPTNTNGPDEIVSGPDGALWFTDHYQGRIGRITTSGSVTSFVPPAGGNGVLGITVGPDGALWFTEDIGRIGRITTGGAISEYVIPLSASSVFPAEIVTGADGNLWYTDNYGGLGKVTTSGIITEYPVTSGSGAVQNPIGITKGPDGAIWFADGLAIWRAQTTAVTPPPVITQITPNPINAGSATLTMRIFGTGFLNAACFIASVEPRLSVSNAPTVYWNSTPLTVTSVTSTEIDVTVPASLLTTPTTATITVTVPYSNSGTCSTQSTTATVQVVGGTLGITPSTLSFVSSGSLPAPQPITVTSTGSPLTFNVSVQLVTSAPVTWLSTSTTSATTPATVNVSINSNAQTLNAGTYTANVNFTATSGTSIKTAVITLMVNDLAITTKVMVFGGLVNAPGPPVQNLSVPTVTGGQMSFTTTTQLVTSANVQWLQVASSGPANTTFQVGVNPSGLPAGTYNALLGLTGTGRSDTFQVGVQLVVKANPDGTLNFSYQIGGSPPGPQPYRITQGAGSGLQCALGAASDQNWLAVTTDSNYAPADLNVTATVNSNTTVNNNYRGIVVWTDIQGDVVVLLATLNIGPMIVTNNNIIVSPPTLSFGTYTLGTAPPSSQTIFVTAVNPGSAVSFTMSQGSDCGWLTLNTPNGFSTPSNIVATMNGGGSAGNHSCTISFNANGTSTVETVVATANIMNQGQITLSASPSTLSFGTYTTGATLPGTQTISVTSSSPGISVSFGITQGSDCGWLTLNTPNGFNTPASVNVTLNGSGNMGNHSCQITFNGSNGAGTASVTVTVNITNPAGPTLTATPSTISLGTYTQGGSAPAAQNINVASTNPLMGLGFTSSLGSDCGSFSLSPSSGSTPLSLSVSVNTSAATVGNHSCVITLNATGATSPTVTVTLVVNPPPFTPGPCTYTMNPPGSFPSGGGSSLFTVQTQAGCPSSVLTSDSSWVHLGSPTSLSGTTSVSYSVDPNSGPYSRSTSIAVLNGVGANQGTIQVTEFGNTTGPGGLYFVPISPPCRVMETRTPATGGDGLPRSGSFGTPSMRAGETRTLDLPQSNVCKIPAGAKAYVVNLTLLAQAKSGNNFVTVYPADESQPRYSSIAEPDAQIVANSAIVRASSNGSINVYSSDNADFLIDIAGYFTDSRNVSNLLFYPLTAPCRVIETRAGQRAPGTFGPPSLVAGATRSFRLPDSTVCSIPRGASAYSMTISAVPQGPLYYITVWPAGTPLPIVSSLNSFDGRIIPNSVIIPASSDGSISVYASNNTDFFVDINGYFAPDNGNNGLFYYPVTQCVAADSSDPTYTDVYGGPGWVAGTSRSIAIPNSQFCSGVPTSAKGYALNLQADQHSYLAYVTMYPTGQPRPLASMLNDFQGQVVTNAAIIPAGPGGSIDVYSSDASNLEVQVSGYFK